ncbi:MAG: sugar phosphate isomerase/epimerase [Clostridia bacterium]|nr:sugar phosphate isomerase/epimerase [Clostridia bacterium]
MILSTQNSALVNRFGYRKSIEILAKAGYDAIDLSLFGHKEHEDFPFGSNDIAFAKELKKIAEDNGVFFNQAHAPFPSEKSGDDEYNKVSFERVVRAIEIAGTVGARQIIVHPVCGFPCAEDCIKYNIDFYNRLVPYIKAAGVKVALENMWGYDDRRGHIIPNYISFASELITCFDALDPEYFTVCLDVGHSPLVGEEPAHAICTLGHDRLGALHVHDVDYRNDLHTLPGMAKINWDAVCKALADIDYKGEFTFEADVFLRGFDNDFVPEAAAYMCKVGRHLISKIEAYKNA